jgi:hypothetical protein
MLVPTFVLLNIGKILGFKAVAELWYKSEL